MVQGVGEVALHLGPGVGRLEALHVLVDEGDQARDVTPGDLIGGRCAHGKNTGGERSIKPVKDFGKHVFGGKSSVYLSCARKKRA